MNEITRLNEDIANIKNRAKIMQSGNEEKGNETPTMNEPYQQFNISKEQLLHQARKEEERQRQMSIISFKPQAFFEK